MDASERVTIEQVAQEAGVSIKTVSRVINCRPDVSPDTRQRVQEVIERRGYHPNAIAQGLRGRQTFTIAFVFIHYESSDWFANPYLAHVISGVVDMLTPAGYFMLTYPVPDSDQALLNFRSLLNSRRVDGVIVNAAVPDDPLMDLVSAAGIPAVYLGLSRTKNGRSSGVTADFRGGTRLAVEYLVGKGHHAIGHIHGNLSLESGYERVEAFRAVMAARGLPVNEAWIRGGGWSRRHGAEAMRQMLAAPERPTAVVAACDLLALGAMETIREEGLSIPRDVAVVGFDDIPMVGDLSTPLTTIHTSWVDFGHVAAVNLLKLIENPAAVPPPVTIPVHLVVRQSA